MNEEPEGVGEAQTPGRPVPGGEAAAPRPLIERIGLAAIALYTKLGVREDVLHFDIAP